MKAFVVQRVADSGGVLKEHSGGASRESCHTCLWNLFPQTLGSVPQ